MRKSGKSIGPAHLTSSSDQEADIILDFSEFNQVHKISAKHSFVNTEPGITLEALNKELKSINKAVPLVFPTWLAS